MAAVVLSHSAEFLRLPDHSALRDLLIATGMLATPTFLLLSGVVCSHLALRGHRSESTTRWRLVDRGLFLLLAVHLVLGFTHALWEPARVSLLHSVYITDAVGVGLIVAAIVMGRMTQSQLIGCGLSLLVVSWTVSCLGAPSDESLRFGLRILVGYDDHAYNDDRGWVVPILPYLGLFMIGMAAGLEYTKLRQQRVPHVSIARACIRIGVCALILAIALKLAGLLLKEHVPASWDWPIYLLTQPFMKIPPSPAYLLAFGGLGLIMAGVVFQIASLRRGHSIAATLAVLGRASLFVYVVQYWLVSVPALALGARGDLRFWSVALVLVLVSAWLLAWIWDRAAGNRLLTVGLRRLAYEPSPPQTRAQQDGSLKSLQFHGRR